MLSNDPRVAELLLLLWNASPREDGIPIAALPETLRDEAFLTAIVSEDLVRFARRNHCHHGGGEHRKLVLEPGWNIARFGEPGIKQVWEAVREALNEKVDEEIRCRIQLTALGSIEASRLLLDRTSLARKVTTSQPDEFELIWQWIESLQGPKGDAKKIILALVSAGGRLSLDELSEKIGWLEGESPWNSARLRANKLLEKVGLPYKLATHDGDALIKAKSSETSDREKVKPQSKRARKTTEKRARGNE